MSRTREPVLITRDAVSGQLIHLTALPTRSASYGSSLANGPRDVGDGRANGNSDRKSDGESRSFPPNTRSASPVQHIPVRATDLVVGDRMWFGGRLVTVTQLDAVDGFLVFTFDTGRRHTSHPECVVDAAEVSLGDRATDELDALPPG